MSCRNAARVDGLFGLLLANNRRLGLDAKCCLDLGLSSTWIRPSAPFPIIHEVGLGSSTGLLLCTETKEVGRDRSGCGHQHKRIASGPPQR